MWPRSFLLALLWSASPLLSAVTAGAQSFTPSWSSRHGDDQTQVGSCVTTDGSGNVIVVGWFESTVDFGGVPLVNAGGENLFVHNDIFVAKFDAAGNHLWSMSFGDTTDQRANVVATDASDNVIVAGTFSGTVDFGGGVLSSPGISDYDVFVVKFGASGNHVWSKRFGGPSGSQNGNALAVDGSGNIVVAGNFAGTVDFGGGPLVGAGLYDIYVAELDAAGNHIWSKRFGDGNNQICDGAAVDGLGNVIVTGYFGSTVDFGGGALVSAGLDDAYVAKFDGSGNHIWSMSFGDADTQWAFGVATDGSNAVLVAGLFYGTTDFGGGALVSAGSGDAFVAKYDAAGNHVWSQRFGDADYQTVRAITTDGANNVLLTGSLHGTADFGGGALTSAGGADVFVAELDAAGNYLVSQRFGDADDQTSYRVAADPWNSVLVTGSFAGSEDFGDGPLVSAGENDVFVARMFPGGRGTGVGGTGAPGTDFLEQNHPNPFSRTTEIGFRLATDARVQIGIYDVMGHRVRDLVDDRFSADRHLIAWDGRDNRGRPVAEGVYFCRLTSRSFVESRRMVLVR
jgi:hypothetical protein